MIASTLGCEQIFDHIAARLCDDRLGLEALHLMLYEGARSGKRKLVSLALEQGANIDRKRPKHGTALDVAVELGRDEIVQLLLEKGADINCTGRDKIPFLIAVERGHERIVQLLIDRGADVNLKDEGGTLLDHALKIPPERFRPGVVRLLIKHGAMPDESNASALKLLETGHLPNDYRGGAESEYAFWEPREDVL